MFSARLQLLTCLVLYASCAHAIMVKFGTRSGPIAPPPPETPRVAPRPYRTPAPVWEERTNDVPDPNAQWRPQLFIPQPLYTQVAYDMQPPTIVTDAQSFVKSYLPQHKPVQAQPVTNYFTPTQILSSQSIPGYGIRYFMPAYMNDLETKKVEARQEDAKLNHIETNDVAVTDESVNELVWKYEKDAAKRKRTTLESRPAPVPYPYEFPAYVRHQ